MAYDFPNAPTVGQNYSGWTWDGEKWVSTAAPPNQSGVIGIQVFTASGTYTPSANMTTCLIECVGGGGGGGGIAGSTTLAGGGGGGGAGSYSRKMATAAQIGTSQAITIGAFGAGGAAGTNPGIAGSVTSVGALCVANGGSGGVGSVGTGASPGAGGTAGTGDVTTPGAYGGSAGGYASTSYGMGGFGGTSLFGAGGRGVITATVAAGVPALGYGSGGGGAASVGTTSTAAGGNGSPGLVVITEYGMTALSPTAAQLGSVRYDLPQGLTASQTAQARANINVLKKNYIVNGGMMISQENGTTAGTTNSYYPVDNFFYVTSGTGAICTVAQIASLTPAGSPNRLRVAVPSTADATVDPGDLVYVAQRMEGLRCADLMFGLPTAKTVVLQFGVKAPAGTYCVAVLNTVPNRSYVAEYVIAAGEANTDVVKSVVIPGDVTGTWATDNNASLQIRWALMVGSTYRQAAGSWGTTNAAGSANQYNFAGVVSAGNFFELFDVSLTEGAIAPPFQVPDYATELALCQRYWQKVAPVYYTMNATAGGQGIDTTFYYSPMRAGPTGAIVGTPTYGNCSGLTIWGAPGIASAAARVSSTAANLITWSLSGANYFSLNARL